MPDLKDSYERKKQKIRERLQYFKKVWKKSDEDIFTELCFCLLTPQSRARICDKVIKNLRKNDILFTGSVDEIRLKLEGVRFPENKARYIVDVRKLFIKSGKIRIKREFNPEDINTTREWLVKNVKGFGYKEASHFLRNIGFGENLAILDRHILKNLKKFKIIDQIPKSFTKKQYLSIEEKIRKFSERMNIPMTDLDLLFWSEETGEIFK